MLSRNLKANKENKVELPSEYRSMLNHLLSYFCVVYGKQLTADITSAEKVVMMSRDCAITFSVNFKTHDVLSPYEKIPNRVKRIFKW